MRVLVLFLMVLATLVANAEAVRPVINEVQYTNRTTMTDAFGDTPDWIELYNPSSEAIDLKGYRLSDHSEGDDYWEFPKYELKPGGYVLVFATGTEKTADNGLYCDFKLSNLEDIVCLFSPGGALLQTIPARCVPADRSLGTAPSGTGLAVLSPSPGYSNAGSEVYLVNYQPDSLWSSAPSGFYAEAVDLAFGNLHSQNEIRFTLDAGIPDDRSALYEAPIHLTDISTNKNRFANKGDGTYKPGNSIAKASVVRAQVFSGGCPASEEKTLTYFIGGDDKFRYGVPVVSLVTEKDNLFDEDKGIAVFGNHQNYYQHGKEWERPVHVDVFDSAQTQIIGQNAGMRIHGRGSRAGNQKSFRLYARDKYGDASFDYPFFNQKPGISTFETLLLRTTNDWSGTAFKDELCQHLVQDMNIDYVAAETAIVFLNGEYWGIYSLRERQDEGYVANNYLVPDPKIDVVAYDLDHGLVAENGSLGQYEQLVEYVDNNYNSDAFMQGLAERLDIDAFIDYYIAQMYLANTDFPNNNVEMWKLDADTARWRMFFFDLDGAMIRTNYNLLSEYGGAGQYSELFPEYSVHLLGVMLKNAEFNRLFHLHFLYALNTTFAPERVLRIIALFEAEYRPLMRDHIYRWGQPVDENKWARNVGMLRTFAIGRPEHLDKEISEYFSNPVYVYPNPANDVISIDLPENIPGTLSVFSSQGVAVYSSSIGNAGESHFQIDLDPGVYTVQLLFSGNVFTEQIIVNQ